MDQREKAIQNTVISQLEKLLSLPDINSQAKLARSLGVPDTTLSKWLSGQQQPGVYKLLAGLERMDIAVEYLLDSSRRPEDYRGAARRRTDKERVSALEQTLAETIRQNDETLDSIRGLLGV